MGIWSGRKEWIKAQKAKPSFQLVLKFVTSNPWKCTHMPQVFQRWKQFAVYSYYTLFHWRAPICLPNSEGKDSRTVAEFLSGADAGIKVGFTVCRRLAADRRIRGSEKEFDNRIQIHSKILFQERMPIRDSSGNVYEGHSESFRTSLVN